MSDPKFRVTIELQQRSFVAGRTTNGNVFAYSVDGPDELQTVAKTSKGELEIVISEEGAAYVAKDGMKEGPTEASDEKAAGEAIVALTQPHVPKGIVEPRSVVFMQSGWWGRVKLDTLPVPSEWIGPFKTEEEARTTIEFMTKLIMSGMGPTEEEIRDYDNGGQDAQALN